MSFEDFDYGGLRDPEPTPDLIWLLRESAKAVARPLIWGRDLKEISYHCARVSEKDATQIAYTPSTIYGRADRQVTLKPGRYLSKFYPRLTPKQVQFYAQWFATGTKPEIETFKKAELRFATTAEDIVHVYINGPSSCMDRRNFDENNSPVRVYASGDLAVAYLVIPGGKPNGGDWIFARALCWPEKQVFGRCYPTVHNYQSDGFASLTESEAAAELIFNKLKADDYKSSGETSGAFNGANIIKEECYGGYVMPYLDQGYGVVDQGDYWTMTDGCNCNYSCQEVGGYIGDHRGVCEDCGNRYNAQDGGGVLYQCYRRGFARGGISVCPSCYSNGFYCEGSEEYYKNDTASIEVGGYTYCLDWATQNGFYVSEHSGNWFDGSDDPRTELSDGTTCSQSEKDEVEPVVAEADDDAGLIDALAQIEIPL